MNVSDELKQYLRSQAFALLCLSLDLGQGEEALLLVKASRDGIAGLRAAAAPAEAGWVVERTDQGPVACLVLRIQHGDAGELSGEVYFDAADERDRELLGHLAAQPRLRVALFDEELDIAWLTEVPWGELQRLQVDQVRDRAEEFLERSGPRDFERAKELFQAALSHDQLLARALPD